MPDQSGVISQFRRERDDGEALPRGQTLFPVDEERVGLDLEVVLQTALVHQQVLWTDMHWSIIISQQGHSKFATSEEHSLAEVKISPTVSFSSSCG